MSARDRPAALPTAWRRSYFDVDSKFTRLTDGLVIGSSAFTQPQTTGGDRRQGLAYLCSIGPGWARHAQMPNSCQSFPSSFEATPNDLNPRVAKD